MRTWLGNYLPALYPVGCITLAILILQSVVLWVGMRDRQWAERLAEHERHR